jgi:hypothetical protein
MHTLNLKIDDSVFSHVKTMLEGFIQEKTIEVIEEDSYDYAAHCPPELVVSSVEEVRRRVYAAQERIKESGGIGEEEYEAMMNKFFKEELGIER